MTREARPRAPELPGWLRAGSDFVTIEIVARPGSPRRGLLRVEDRGLVIGIASPPEKGKANDELIGTVAEIAGVGRSSVSLIRGATARSKAVKIMTGNPASIAKKLSALSLKA